MPEPPANHIRLSVIFHPNKYSEQRHSCSFYSTSRKITQTFLFEFCQQLPFLSKDGLGFSMEHLARKDGFDTTKPFYYLTLAFSFIIY